MSLTGPNEIDSSITIQIEVTEVVDYEGFYGLVANLEYDHDKLDLTSITGLNKYDLTYNAKENKILVYKTIGTKERTAIISMKFNNKGLLKDEKTNIALTNMTISDGHKDIEVPSISKTITCINNKASQVTSDGKKLSNNNYLKSITINNKKLDFDKNNLNYDIVVANIFDKVTIDAKPEDKKATINGNGKYNLLEGKNEIILTVTSETNDERTYIININREEKESDQAYEDLFLATKSNNIKDNKIIIPIISLFVLLLIIITIFRRKDKKK